MESNFMHCISHFVVILWKNKQCFPTLHCKHTICIMKWFNFHVVCRKGASPFLQTARKLEGFAYTVIAKEQKLS